jgi:hypothetical protein
MRGEGEGGLVGRLRGEVGFQVGPTIRSLTADILARMANRRDIGKGRGYRPVLKL